MTQVKQAFKEMHKVSQTINLEAQKLAFDRSFSRIDEF